jgi:sigma-B regulation protein RsbU (phosphoserine phosphatase)
MRQKKTEKINTQNVLLYEKHLRQELRYAAHIQRNLLPKPFYAPAGIQFDAVNTSAHEVGGDFYDYFPVNEHEFAFFIGDVCGKGIPAAIFMASAHSTLKVQALDDPHPARMLPRADQILTEKTREEFFITTFYGVYNTVTHTLRFINAGHPTVLLFRPSTASCASLYNSNFPLGMFAPLPFADATIQLEPGDRLLLYTDGVSEAVNPTGEAFGVQRIVEILLEQGARSPQALREAIMQEVKHFAAGQEPQDDMTVMVVQV